MHRFPWLVVAVAVVALTACSDDGDGERVSSPRSTSSSPSTPTTATTTTTTTTAPPSRGNEACELVTRDAAEQIFGEPARPGAPEDPGGDAVCVWEAGGDDEGPYQFLEFRVHEGGELRSVTVNTGGGIVLTSQWGGDGRMCALRYLGTGSVGESDIKQAALDELKTRIGPCTT